MNNKDEVLLNDIDEAIRLHFKSLKEHMIANYQAMDADTKNEVASIGAYLGDMRTHTLSDYVYAVKRKLPDKKGRN
tara:strand:- start:1090 stop:1317 length:228 start_codon:yes stop_codon:yes gene_type:complete